MSCTAIIVAAGKGLRAGGELPKQFRKVGGKALVAHAAEAFAAHPSFDRIVVVIGEGQQDELLIAVGDTLQSRVSYVFGGAERQDSVRAGLELIDREGGCAHVFIHDAARPFLPKSVIDRLLTALPGHIGAVPALPVVDTLARGEKALGETVARDGLCRIQTPQAFRFEDILAAHRSWSGASATDDAQMVRAKGGEVALVEGDPALEKVTSPQDFAAAEARLMLATTSRAGMGFDVHRLESGKDLWLCGVKLDHSHGLSGHSDADVALHALTDAILGAIGEGDIGQHFPPSDPQWRGAPSHLFLEHARDLVTNRRGTIDHVDLTIICEAPKIGPHRDAMRARIASLLRVSPGAVSIKATTTERLGFTGRGEGIAAQAVATVRTMEL